MLQRLSGKTVEFSKQKLSRLFTSSVCLIFLVAILVNQWFAPQLPASAAGRRLVFMSFDVDQPNNDLLETSLSLPNIDGLAIETRWPKMEPVQGKYNWNNIDQAIRIAAKHKKYVTIYFLGSPKVPDWFREAKVQQFFAGSLNRGIIVDAVPWDKTYLSLYTKLLQAAAQHFKALNMTPYIFAVGNVAPARSCTLTACMGGKLGNVPYNRDAYMAACRQMVDVYAACFPSARQLISVPTGETICAPNEDKLFFRQLMDYALTKHKQSCWIQGRDLSSTGSANATPYLDYAARTGLAYQMKGPSAVSNADLSIGGSFPENFGQAISAGIRNGAIYFEVWSNDATNSNPSIQAAINSIHN